jgi:sortase A
VLICSGVLLLIDAGLTLVWQEPVSAYLAQQQQDQLGSELDKATKNFTSRELQPLHGLANGHVNLAPAARRWKAEVRDGQAFGRISIPKLHRSYVVVQGTREGDLRKGPGHYPGTSFPGMGGTIAIAGHRTTYLAPFRTINQLKPGDQIILRMPYGTLTYAVEKTQIVPPTALWITRRVPGKERLVLSACHPLYSASHRIVVFARLASTSSS